MNVAVFGGGFNPPHVGHAMVASWVKLTDLADEVWLVPSFSHPFGKTMPPFLHRVGLCRALATELGEWVRVPDVEASLPLPTGYTLDLLRHLRSMQPEHTFRFVMGSDNLNLSSEWHGFEEIRNEFNPIFVQRAGAESPDTRAACSPVFPDVSSTDIRRRLACGEPVSHLVPASVLRLLKPGSQAP